jgi:hypothetical protein
MMLADGRKPTGWLLGWLAGFKGNQQGLPISSYV